MYDYECDLVRVIDGDTVVVDIDLGFDVWERNRRIRLFGIDCPEMSTPEGKVAKQYTIDWFAKSPGPYRLLSYKDKSDSFGRYLGQIYKGDESLNASLLRDGHARSYRAA